MTTSIDREPLLHRGGGASSTTSSRRQAGAPPPRHAFFQNSNHSQQQYPHGLDSSVITVDDSSFHFLGEVGGMEADEHYHNMTSSQSQFQQQQHQSSSTPPPYVVADTERELQRVVLRILGRAYLRDGSFWWPTLPMAIFLGAVLALSTLLFLGSVHYLLNLWFHPNRPDDHTPSFIWPIYTTLGGLVTGGMFYLAGIPVGAVRTFFHDMVDLQGRPFETPLVVAACWVGLCLGCPLGPEMALGAMASGLATVLSRVFLQPQQQSIEDHLLLDNDDNHDDNTDHDAKNRRIRATWVQMAMAGSIGGVFPTPILAILLVHELVVTGRPMAVPWDGWIQSQSPQQRRQQQQQQHRHRSQQQQQQQQPSPATKRVDHDLMEQVTLMGACALTAGVVVRGVVRRVLNKDLDMTFPLNTAATLEYRDWHLLAAIPLGLACGMVTSLGLIVTSIARTIRTRVSQRFHQRQQQQQQQLPHNGDVPSLIFPTLAGLINGLAAACVTPYVLGSGVDVMRDLLEQAVHPHHNITNTTMSYASPLFLEDAPSENNNGLLSPHSYMLIGLTKLIVFSMSLGFGMVGGPVVPSLFVGLCLGLAMTSAFGTTTATTAATTAASADAGAVVWVWPLSLTVPCCMAATAGSMVPAPFALIGTVSILFALQPTQMGPVLVATMVAFGVTGGLGILRHVAEQRLGDDNAAVTEDNENNHNNNDEDDDDLDNTNHHRHHHHHHDGEHQRSEICVSPLPSDEEILKGIRSAIFGSSSRS